MPLTPPFNQDALVLLIDKYNQGVIDESKLLNDTDFIFDIPEVNLDTNNHPKNTVLLARADHALGKYGLVKLYYDRIDLDVLPTHEGMMAIEEEPLPSLIARINEWYGINLETGDYDRILQGDGSVTIQAMTTSLMFIGEKNFQLNAAAGLVWHTPGDPENVYSVDRYPSVRYTGTFVQEDLFEWAIQWTPSSDGSAPPIILQTADKEIVQVHVQDSPDFTNNNGQMSSGVGIVSLSINGVMVNNTLVIVVSDTEGNAYEAIGSYFTLSETPLAAGQLVSEFCDGFNRRGNYSDGLGRTYDKLIQANSVICGYVAPGPTWPINVNGLWLDQDDSLIMAGYGYSTNTSLNEAAAVRILIDGGVDNAFGTNGVMLQEGGPFELFEVQSLARQSNGKIILAGMAYDGISSSYGFALTRLHSDGITSTDTTFGTNGFTFIKQSAFYEKAYSVVVQDDNSIVVSGQSVEDGFMYARLTANGILDTTYAVNGIGTFLPNANSRPSIYSSAIQSDGKVVFGCDRPDNPRSATVLRVNTDGSLDGTFGTGGIVNFTVGLSREARGVVIQPDGRILVVARQPGVGDENGPITVTRLNTDGTLDTSFASDGLAEIEPLGFLGEGNGGADSMGTSIALQSDGKVVVIGTFYYSDQVNDRRGFALARLNTDGTLDTAFGTDGIVKENLVGGEELVLSAFKVAIQQSGKIVLSGSTEGPMGTQYYIRRFNTDGSTDTTFGTNGYFV